jgi:hypothetical protein
MPLTIPQFSQYQGVLVPLRGLWNAKPPEGDRFLSAEIDWSTVFGGFLPLITCVQFAIGGNSPVALSQIAALFVDNSRCGADVQFIFPDSGFSLTVAAHNQVMMPVLTNALMFYVNAPNAAGNDVTILQVLNSNPPPIPLVAALAQNHASAVQISASSLGGTTVAPTSVSGTLNTLSISLDAVVTGASGVIGLTLNDGNGQLLWETYMTIPTTVGTNYPINVPGLNVRFQKGIVINVGPTTLNAGSYFSINAYYTSP